MALIDWNSKEISYAEVFEEPILIPVEDVIRRLEEMKPEVTNLEKFDKSRKHDEVYCVEWGIKKGQWIEAGVYDKYIKELKDKL